MTNETFSVDICDEIVMYFYNVSPKKATMFEFVMKGICIPSIASLGIVGNLLNFLFLTRRYIKLPVNNLERSSLWGLIALAAADLCFCACLIPEVAFHTDSLCFKSRGFHFLYAMYDVYLKEAFIKISTSLTMMIALSRCFVVCFPLRAKIVVRLRTIKIITAAIYIFWFLLLLPLLWSHEAVTIEADKDLSVTVMTNGYLYKNRTMEMTFSVLWAVLGYLLPISVLLVCNVTLMRALRQTHAFQLHNRRYSQSMPNSVTTSSYLSLNATLVTLICMMFLMVSPSEILYFIIEVVTFTEYDTIKMATICVNFLQTLYLSSHFMLYVIVNANFRRSVSMMCARSGTRPRLYTRTSHSTLESRSLRRARLSVCTCSSVSMHAVTAMSTIHKKSSIEHKITSKTTSV